MNRPRTLARLAVPAAALLGAITLAGPASAHVEVEPGSAQALATDVVVGFNAEGESDTAGISKLQVVLPTGLTPADVTLAEGAAGWQLTATADGYTVTGPALAPGKSADYKIKIRRLPDAKELAFKTLVSYTDGHVDRWIELPQGGAEPEHPAPVLKLTPAAAPTASSTPSASTSPSAAPSTPSATPSTTSAAPVPSSSGSSSSSSAAPVVIGVVVVIAAAVGGVFWWRRRSSAS
ncbi:DUF1775 domain-containing protein [Kitasatospora sp. McL0602]|uniref:DUF1775 domain-containing protein n=1 Tax=Kitasatospora sp. McL0602 TaxID=3439530 RepID=UPI003F89DAF5